MNKIVDLLNTKNNAKIKVSRIFCPNYHHLLRVPTTPNYKCKNCKNIGCKFCVKNDRNICLMCSYIGEIINVNNEICKLCGGRKIIVMCHLCGNILQKCKINCRICDMTYTFHCKNGVSCRLCFKYRIQCNICKY